MKTDEVKNTNEKPFEIKIKDIDSKEVISNLNEIKKTILSIYNTISDKELKDLSESERESIQSDNKEFHNYKHELGSIRIASRYEKLLDKLLKEHEDVQIDQKEPDELLGIFKQFEIVHKMITEDIASRNRKLKARYTVIIPAMLVLTIVLIVSYVIQTKTYNKLNNISSYASQILSLQAIYPTNFTGTTGTVAKQLEITAKQLEATAKQLEVTAKSLQNIAQNPNASVNPNSPNQVETHTHQIKDKALSGEITDKSIETAAKPIEVIKQDETNSNDDTTYKAFSIHIRNHIDSTTRVLKYRLGKCSEIKDSLYSEPIRLSRTKSVTPEALNKMLDNHKPSDVHLFRVINMFCVENDSAKSIIELSKSSSTYLNEIIRVAEREKKQPSLAALLTSITTIISLLTFGLVHLLRNGRIPNNKL